MRVDMQDGINLLAIVRRNDCAKWCAVVATKQQNFAACVNMPIRLSFDILAHTVTLSSNKVDVAHLSRQSFA
jgi:hypothetical protein